MAQRIHISGKEYETKALFDGLGVVNSVEMGLYNQSTDQLTAPDTDPDTDITTEPDTAHEYARQTISIPTDVTPSKENTRWRATFDVVTFSVNNNTELVDAYFIVINFNTADYLYISADLDQTYDLGMINELEVTGAAIERATGISS